MKGTLVVKYLIINLVAFTILSACQPKTSDSNEDVAKTNAEEAYKATYNNLPANETGDIVRKAIEGAGGWNNWTAKKALSYIKIITSYDSTGAIKRVSRQLHEYNLSPKFQARISYEDNGKQYVSLNNGEQAWKLEDGKIMEDKASMNSAWNSTFGSHYVMCMPFKLPDPGTQLNFEGLTTLPNGKEVNALKATYEEGAGSNALLHTWWYFFDPNTNELVANFLDFSNGYDFTEYVSFATVDGVKINKERKSHVADQSRNIIYLSSTYVNEEIQFKDSFPASYFEPSK